MYKFGRKKKISNVLLIWLQQRLFMCRLKDMDIAADYSRDVCGRMI
jgi:hypothetical protein